MSRTETVLRVISFLALIAGVPGVIVFGWILFVPGEAVCDGAVMSPGQTCGLPFTSGDSYEEMVAETTVRRTVAYAACGLAVAGVAGLVAVGAYRRRQGPAPRWFTPETTLSDDPGHVTPEVLTRAMTTYAVRLADREATLGPDHPETSTWRYHLANVMVLAGDPTRAVSLYEAVAAARARTLGADHPDTFTAQAGATYAHALGGDASVAVTMARALLARGRQIMPENDPRMRTLRRVLSLAEARVSDGR
jgi:hypothetical protein